jgi:hypothetical protein
MDEETFKRLRHIAWDPEPLGGDIMEQSFCTCENPESHAHFEMDPTGERARAITEPPPLPVVEVFKREYARVWEAQKATGAYMGLSKSVPDRQNFVLGGIVFVWRPE